MYKIAIVTSMKACFRGGVDGCFKASVYKLRAYPYYLSK
jgi:hypothetical protein